MITLENFEKCYAGRLPPLGATQDTPDPMVQCKFYDLQSTREWYIIEGEKRGDDYQYYGYIADDTPKLGFFTFKELETQKTIVHSVLFRPRFLSYIKAYLLTRQSSL
jgi:hypothetical protein